MWFITEAPYNGEESEERDFIRKEMTSNVSNGTIEDILRQPDRRDITLSLVHSDWSRNVED